MPCKRETIIKLPMRLPVLYNAAKQLCACTCAAYYQGAIWLPCMGDEEHRDVCVVYSEQGARLLHPSWNRAYLTLNSRKSGS